jgi:uncharacterized membrane protein
MAGNPLVEKAKEEAKKRIKDAVKHAVAHASPYILLVILVLVLIAWIVGVLDLIKFSNIFDDMFGWLKGKDSGYVLNGPGI